jgi:predicted O-methyltransferase YrrM
MYSKLEIAEKYIHYYIKAYNGKGHGMHSPFVYDFIINVLNKNQNSINSIEQLRNHLLQNNNIIDVEDFGAGSVTKALKHRTIASIAKNAAKPKKYAQVLHNIAKHYQCNNIIELGTSLGISSAYMATANPFCKVYTCEGSKNIAQLAKENFKKLFIENIEVLEGEFNKSYTQALEHCNTVDLLYVDGNHQYQPTINYFEQALPKLHNSSIVIFDDIHWSKGMEDAWEHIKQLDVVSETIDLFFIGIVFVRKEQKAKQHFTIRY